HGVLDGVEAHRRDLEGPPGVEEAVPERRGLRAGDEEVIAKLPRLPGAEVGSLRGGVVEAEVREPHKLGPLDRGEELPGEGTVEREERVSLAEIADRDGGVRGEVGAEVGNQLGGGEPFGEEEIGVVVVAE